MRVGCCYGCKDRQVGCHGSCEAYLNQKAINDEARAKIRQENLVNATIIENKHKAVGLR